MPKAGSTPGTSVISTATAIFSAVVCIAETGRSEQTIIDRARRDLVGYKESAQARFFVDDLPKNAIGKVLKQELKGRYAGTYSPAN